MIFSRLEGFFYDLRFAARGLRRDRAFSLTAIAILALAIGLNVTVFTVMNTVLYRGFPYVKRNDRLVYLQEKSPLRCCFVSYPDFQAWNADAQSFQGMALLAGTAVTVAENGGAVERASAALMTANTFRLLGAQPILGRDFSAADAAPGAPPVVILSYSFWERRYGRNPGILGRTVRMNDKPTTIIGVMPQGFGFPEYVPMWMPLIPDPEMQAGSAFAHMALGRLTDGATFKAARTELATINLRLASDHPATNRDVVPEPQTWSEFVIGPDAKVIYGSMWGATWFVLLIACANLANLALARTAGRSREISTRIALGVGRWRMIRQFLMESALLSAIGGLLGWWIAKWSVATYAAATASQFQVLDYTLDSGTRAYLILISVAAAILFGLVPAARVARFDVNATLKGGARGVRGKRLFAVLVAGQMALAVILLSGAGVLVRSFMKFYTADLGVKPENILTGFVNLPPSKYSSAESQAAFFDLLKTRLQAIPGVESATLASRRPAEGSVARTLELDGRAARPAVSTLAVGPEYFGVLGAKLISGREFGNADRPAGLPVAIVNQRFAEKFWPGEDPLGKRVRLLNGDKPDEWRTVVGVGSNVIQDDRTRQSFEPLVYVPYQQQPVGSMWFFARTRVPPDRLATATRNGIQGLDPDLFLYDFSTLPAALEFSSSMMDVAHHDTGKNAVLSPIFASIALLLASIGLYAVVAHSVSQRTREIGVRMAIGAAARDIGRLVLREGMRPVGFGLVAGLLLSLAINRLLQSQLVGVSAYDPMTLTVTPAVLLLVALLGCRIPARRAMRVDPSVALRQD